MAHSRTFEAILLRTYDVGEADRYCIFFTRERGRLPGRGPGARKPTSKMCGALLPFQHLSVDLRESSAGWIVAGAQRKGDTTLDIGGFAAASEGIEVLLRLTQDDEPLPDVFRTTLTFLRACEARMPEASLAYRLRLLHLLGFLPAEEELALHVILTPAPLAFLRAIRGGMFPAVPLEDREREVLEMVVGRYLHDQLSGPLKAPGVVHSL